MREQQAWKLDDFFSLKGADLAELKKKSVEHTFAKGERIWDEGDVPEAVWIVQKGRTNMAISSAEGTESLIHFCTKGQAFCPAAAITGKAYPCAAVAATEVVAIAVPRSTFLSVFGRLPEMAKSLLRQMAPMMCEAHCRQAMSVEPVQHRLAHLLGGLHRRYDGHDLPFTRQELASMSGTTVETTIRTLSKWEKSGVIHSERGSIQVRRPEGLEMAVAA